MCSQLFNVNSGKAIKFFRLKRDGNGVWVIYKKKLCPLQIQFFFWNKEYRYTDKTTLIIVVFKPMELSLSLILCLLGQKTVTFVVNTGSWRLFYNYLLEDFLCFIHIVY